MPTRRTMLVSAAMTIAASIAAPPGANAKEPIQVVATFSILGDLVERIGGEHIALSTLVGRNGDAHVFQPSPSDARAVGRADVLVVNGLEYEGWLDRLIEAPEFRGSLAVATAGVTPLAYEKGRNEHGDEEHDDHENRSGEKHDDHDAHAHHDGEDDDHAGHDHGAYDPHAWHSVGNAVIYVDNVTAALAKADPDNAASFYRNRAAYVAELEGLEREIRALTADLSEERRAVITTHDAFGYFGDSYGLRFAAPQGLSTESEPSAADVAEMIVQIRDEGITAVFVESIADNRLLERIAEETGAAIGGTLYSDALSDEAGPAPTYIDMMRHNAKTLTQALGS